MQNNRPHIMLLCFLLLFVNLSDKLDNVTREVVSLLDPPPSAS